MTVPAEYLAACDYPGFLDEAAVEQHLRDYLTALGIERHVVRLRRGWTVDDYPSLGRHVDSVLDQFRDALAARAARDARDALDARAALDARVARDARAALDARAGRAARAGRDARAGRAGRAARERFARWCFARSGWWFGWDLSWMAIAMIGARQTRSASTLAWSKPVYDAYLAGCWCLYWTEDTLYWVAKPTLYGERVDGTRRLHRADGPAVVADDDDIYFWQGTLIPAEWIEDRASLTPQMALTWTNVEQRRAACEILGWDKILSALDARVINEDAPEIGTLVEVNLPDSGPERFLRVMCGTGRQFALPVPRNMRTALQAQAWTWGLNTKTFKAPETRT